MAQKQRRTGSKHAPKRAHNDAKKAKHARCWLNGQKRKEANRCPKISG